MVHKTRVYPHNDLLNLAYYHRQIIEKKVADGESDAIALDCMSCLIALAFSVEAIANLIGSKVVGAWDEWAPYKDKMKSLGKTLGFTFDPAHEPFKTLQVLKGIRDQMAHGKPIETVAEVTDQKAIRRAMACPWDEYLTPKFVQHAYSQVKQFKGFLLKQAKVPLVETLTSATSSSWGRPPHVKP